MSQQNHLLEEGVTTGVGVDIHHHDTTMVTTLQQQLGSDTNDVVWIIDETEDALSTCDHSDHEHVMQSSSSSSGSLHDMHLLDDDDDDDHDDDHEEDVPVVAPKNSNNNTAVVVVETKMNNNNTTAMRPQRSVSISKFPPPEPVSPVDVAATSNKVIGRDQSTISTIPTPASPSRTPRQQQNRRLMKINGDDTILNLYAATVAKAISSPPPNKKEATTKTTIAPVVTSPTNKPRAVFSRSSLTIRPEVSKPTKKTTTTLGTTTNALRHIHHEPMVPISHIASGTPIKILSSKSTTAPPTSSPLTKARSMATGNAKMPTRIQLEVSDHDDDDDEDALLESFDSQLDNQHVIVTNKSNIHSGSKQNVDNDKNYVDQLKAIAAADMSKSKSSLLDANPETEQQHQQYLHLEIAKELDGGRNSRRFQLAIQSHVSSLTLGTFTDPEMNGDDLSISGDTFRSNYSLTSGYHHGDDDDDETFVSRAAVPPPNVRIPQLPLSPTLTDMDDDDDDDDDDNEAIEVSLEGRFSKSNDLKAEDESITKSPHEKAAKKAPPAFLFQKSHSWMRNRLWGQPLQEQHDNDIDNDIDESINTNIDHVTSHSVSDAVSPTMQSSTLPQNEWLPSVESQETKSKPASNWNKDIAFYLLFYVIPLTHQAGVTLPQIYFLIELVDVYDTDLYLAGIYLCISLLLRYAIYSFMTKMPRITAILGTVVALTGYLILFLISELDKNQLTSESNVVNEFLFIFGNVIIGSSEMISCVHKLAQDDTRLSMTSNCDDSGNMALVVGGWEAQFIILQLSTVIFYAVGGAIYEYWDIFGIAVTGIAILGVQLICLLVVIQTEPICPSKLSISQESQKLNFFQPDYGEGDMKLRRDGKSLSFRTMVTPELATIEESPVAESDSEDDPNTRITFFDAERSEQLQLKRQSFVSNSSGTPEFDNRTSIREMNANSTQYKSEQFHTDFYEAMINNHVPTLQWAEIYVTLGVTVQLVLKGLVLGVGTLLLFQEFGRGKATIGYVYAATSLCGAVANMIPKSFLDSEYLGRCNTYGTLYLFGATYMMLLTAFSYFSTYVVGVLLMSLFIGLFVRSMNEVEIQLIHSNSENYERTLPYRKWIRLTSSLLVTLLSPILYDVLPRLPNMIGSSVCFAITVFVWCGSNMAKENDTDDGKLNNVNTTADTIPSDAINDSMKHDDAVEMSKLEFEKSWAVHRVRLESLLDRSI